MFKAHAQRITDHPGKAVGYLLVLLIVSVILPQSGAGELMEFRVTHNRGNYHVRMVMVVHAPERYVRTVLTDYAHIYRLNPSITESEILPSPVPGVARVRTRMRGCVLFFCKNVERVEDVRELDTGELQADIVPELSNLRSGKAEWKIQEMGDITQVTYTRYMEPDFFIPPLIGSFFVKRNIGREIMIGFKRLEHIAQTRALLDRQPSLQRAAYGIGTVACAEECGDSSPDCPQ